MSVFVASKGANRQVSIVGIEIDSIRSFGSSISSMINDGIAGMTNDDSNSGGESMIATLPSGSIKVINDNIDNDDSGGSTFFYGHWIL